EHLYINSFPTRRSSDLFNLHDQNTRYSAGKTPNQASISFLATAYNEERAWNENRKRAMQLICEMKELVQNILPNQIGRFSDEFRSEEHTSNSSHVKISY